VRRQWVEPRYGLQWDFRGRQVQVLLQAGHWIDVHEPGRYEQRPETVWVPAGWVHGG
jgi:hypothetical protein